MYKKLNIRLFSGFDFALGYHLVPVFNKIGTHVGFSFFEDNLVGDSLEVYIRGDELFGNALHCAALNFPTDWYGSAYAGCRR